MNQEERLIYMIRYLLNEDHRYCKIAVPSQTEEKKKLLRSLMNVRPPQEISQDFLNVQDEYLKEELGRQRITCLEDLRPVRQHIYLWQGDITKLKADAIVNAGNSTLLGCFIPCHGCIDNAIHSFAGIQLRLECQQVMEKQGIPEPAGQAKITKAYNLPAKYIIHTVGPVIQGAPTKKDQELLSSCYLSCLKLADAYKLESIAFCCISTGEFHFPHDLAAKTAIDTVERYLKETKSEIEVIFNVFKEEDHQIYRRLLETNRTNKRNDGKC